MEILVESKDLCYKLTVSNGAGEDGEMKRSKIRAALTVAGVAWFLLLGLRGPDLAWSQGGGSASIFQSYAKPLPLPDFSLEDLQGNAVQIQAFKGKVILLNFWATW
jgi:cytochrome oxidase Cu insertion factor (SCO1/SenC/PrrC family)